MSETIATRSSLSTPSASIPAASWNTLSLVCVQVRETQRSPSGQRNASLVAEAATCCSNDAPTDPGRSASNAVSVTPPSVSNADRSIRGQALDVARSHPLVFLPFISSAFVPTDTMPRPVRVLAENQPVTWIVNTIQDLFAQQRSAAKWIALAWRLGILVLAYVLAMVGYRRKIT